MNQETLDHGAEGVEGASAAGTEGTAGVQENLEKKYTDDDVDRILAKKIAAERSKNIKQYSEELEKRERAVLQRELAAEAKERLANDSLPSSLLELMNYNSTEEFEESYAKVSKVFKETLKQRISGRKPENPDTSRFSGVDVIAEAFALPTQ